ncbi:MAG: hypothetical protein WC765_02595 [Phycisphaerae bacterium]|jgi:hypothetical protein
MNSDNAKLKKKSGKPMKTYRHIVQICCLGIFFVTNSMGADGPYAFFEGFEDQKCKITYFVGDREHCQLNGVALVTDPVHSGEQACMIDVTTDGDYMLPYLYFSGKTSVVPEPGQKLEGWMKVDTAKSDGDGVTARLGISVSYPAEEKVEGGLSSSAQAPLAIVEQGVDGWQKFQSEDILECFTKLAEKKGYNPAGLFVSGWLLHLTGVDLKNKRVVVYIDDLVIK